MTDESKGYLVWLSYVGLAVGLGFLAFGNVAMFVLFLVIFIGFQAIALLSP